MDLNDILENRIIINRRIIKGVYFLIKNEKIIYIGKSKNILKRIREHQKGHKIKFDSYYFIEILNPNFSELLIIERKYIEKFKPLYNFSKNPDLKNINKFLFSKFFRSDITYLQLSNELRISENKLTNYFHNGRKDEIMQKKLISYFYPNGLPDKLKKQYNV